MDKFEVTILGCGSATPSTRHYTSAQVVDIHDKLFLVDCGEGTQIQLRRAKVAFARIGHIFISHLHGDHCFGLLGVISSFGLLGRTAPLFVHAPVQMWEILEKELDFYCRSLEFPVEFKGFSTETPTVIYDDRSVTVETIPLIHSVPCTGFLFREKQSPDHLDRAAADFHGVPRWDYDRIKQGGDFTKEDGTVIPHRLLTKPAALPRSYAYCCDTAYNPDMTEQIHGVSALYHDSTYLEEDSERARKYLHSTAAQAARTALQAQAGKLVLGHYSAKYQNENGFLDEASEIFPGTVLANEGTIIEL